MKPWIINSTATQDDWQALVKKELKTDDIKRLLERPLVEGGVMPLLAQETPVWFDASFKRAALSYTWTRSEDVKWEALADLVAQGVWDFILDPALLGWDKSTLVKQLELSEKALKNSNARLWVVTQENVKLPAGAFKVISGTEVVTKGGHAAHELALLLCRIIDWAKNSDGTSIGVAVTLNSEFFKSIAKKRALKAVIEAAFSEMQCSQLHNQMTCVARSSWREFTAYDYNNNMLRNATAVAAGYICGAGVVESLPCDLLIETSTTESQKATRVALTTQLVLQSESYLGEVSDPASGGYVLEHLTRTLGEDTWALMQKMIDLPDEQRLVLLDEEVKAHWQGQQKKFRSRKLVQTGVNDFPNAAEEIKFKPRFKMNDHVRLAREFEELRAGLGDKKPKVAIAVVGDYAALQARFNFTKNYFELLGLEVTETGKGLSVSEAKEWFAKQNKDVTAWVSKDEDHAELSAMGPLCYIAGKTEIPHCRNLFAGQDVLSVLQELTSWWRAKA